MFVYIKILKNGGDICQFLQYRNFLNNKKHIFTWQSFAGKDVFGIAYNLKKIGKQILKLEREALEVGTKLIRIAA